MDISRELRKIAANLERLAAADEVSARELELYLLNDSQCYDWSKSYLANIVKKLAAGTFDIKKAPQLLLYYVERCADKYARDFGSPGDTGKRMFDKPTRMAVAESLVGTFLERVKDGQGDEFVPKKYQDTWEATKEDLSKEYGI